jgi:hypothetical protein
MADNYNIWPPVVGQKAKLPRNRLETPGEGGGIEV